MLILFQKSAEIDSDDDNDDGTRASHTDIASELPASLAGRDESDDAPSYLRDQPDELSDSELVAPCADHVPCCVDSLKLQVVLSIHSSGIIINQLCYHLYLQR